MKINVAKSAGFCSGVKRALDIAMRTAASKTPVYMLGDIVHNEDVVSCVRQAGIRKIRRLTGGKGKTLLIRAHGAGIGVFTKAARLGYYIVDATCPMVKEIHRIASQMEAKGRRIIVIGDKSHDEVRGILGQLHQKAIVVDGADAIAAGRLRGIRKAAVIVQSTQNIEKVLKIVDLLKAIIPELAFYNTICRPTRVKQEEIRSMPLQNDAMIIIGSRSSANTRRLYEISRRLNKKTYWVQSKKDVKVGWFEGIARVGITAGASTPDWITQEIVAYLKQL
ncbi:MAG TPA: 4-hydroxy-3-methylbut-2-enyl diphosphate reductase [Patescibacteria group bacterium]|nr:4-hydroxy-3-methylbut-2-enyl diphosphate reductase [Patescibacteria group bacterium]